MHRWLILQLEAPLMAFGGILIDQVGPTRDFPSASMLVGLMGNALGWRWTDTDRLQALQDRLVFAARRDREGGLLTDTQNAKLESADKGWTTFGEPEGRDGASYSSPHRRFRDYHADLSVRVVIRFLKLKEEPTLDQIAEAIDRPSRPLYIGRKPCLPSKPLLGNEKNRWISARDAYEALTALPGSGNSFRAVWPIGEGPQSGQKVDRVIDMWDLRNWHTNFHGDSRRLVEGRVVGEE